MATLETSSRDWKKLLTLLINVEIQIFILKILIHQLIHKPIALKTLMKFTFKEDARYGCENFILLDIFVPNIDCYMHQTESKQGKYLLQCISQCEHINHIQTHKQKHMYIIRVKEGNKLWSFATDSLYQFNITFILLYKKFCLHLDHQISQYCNLLKSLSMKD